MEMGSLTEEQVEKIVEQAETMATEAEKVADAEKAKKRLEEIESGVRDNKGNKKPVAKGAPAKAAAPAPPPPAPCRRSCTASR
jgi:ribosomal protein S13